MQTFDKVLVATDFSPTCENALAHAAAVAKRNDAELHVLNVQVLPSDIHGWQGQPSMDEVDRLIEESARQQMQKFLADADDRVTHKVVRDVDEAAAILQYAQELDMDLLVMGTRARRGVSRLFLGSVAAEVLRAADLPVLVVKPDHTAPVAEYANLVLPVDMHEEPANLRHRARGMCFAGNPTYHVIHAASVGGYPGPEVALEHRQQLDKGLGQLVATADLPGQTQSELLSGTDARDEQINHYASEHGADLIVMGRTSVSKMRRVLLGSTTDRVLRDAPCPVLAWRDHRQPTG